MVEGVAHEFWLNILGPAKIFYDNKVAIQIAANPMFHEHTNHIEIDCHYIHEKVQDNIIVTQYISS